MLSIDALAVDEAGTVHGVFPAGELVFPVPADTVRRLDSLVRAVLAATRVVSAAEIEGGRPGRRGEWPAVDELVGFVRERMAALDRRTDVVVRNSLRRAAAQLDHPYVGGAVAAGIREHARAVAAPGWRPDLDPGAWVPDPVLAARQVEQPYVTPDVSALVLFAALGAVGPDAEAMPWTDALRALPWQRLGGTEDAEPAAVARGDVVVGLSIHDDVVDRLDYAVAGGRAHLAVTLADA
ncbi:hypothetical protein ACTI_83770 [Actinoplanes sp. OR16]|uniref:hypothetical protein n=1 Tax=Actinoplanes sp. OR16 TaxID=946334 RepID=UPI000F7032F6|nr:hypothetical protein [Actinoplanes sp. OR16]BBH71692.1 hypothetical protein ACTI_83770 [Actinoplanes sp. OR16]